MKPITVIFLALIATIAAEESPEVLGGDKSRSTDLKPIGTYLDCLGDGCPFAASEPVDNELSLERLREQIEIHLTKLVQAKEALRMLQLQLQFPARQIRNQLKMANRFGKRDKLRMSNRFG